VYQSAVQLLARESTAKAADLNQSQELAATLNLVFHFYFYSGDGSGIAFVFGTHIQN